jgi:hypothetical protein
MFSSEKSDLKIADTQGKFSAGPGLIDLFLDNSNEKYGEEDVSSVCCNHWSADRNRDHFNDLELCKHQSFPDEI